MISIVKHTFCEPKIDKPPSIDRVPLSIVTEIACGDQPSSFTAEMCSFHHQNLGMTSQKMKVEQMENDDEPTEILVFRSIPNCPCCRHICPTWPVLPPCCRPAAGGASTMGHCASAETFRFPKIQNKFYMMFMTCEFLATIFRWFGYWYPWGRILVRIRSALLYDTFITL